VGLAIDCIPFIVTEAIDTVEVQQEIEQLLLQSAHVVFTSMNAVDAVAAELYGHQPDWTIYCIGAATRRQVAHFFGADRIAGTAPDADQLAEKIIAEAETEEVFFFCGDQRRDELPNRLRQAGIGVAELVVYHTVEVPHRISRDYPAVLFFSPSAVRSFFRLNKLSPGAVAFAIGKTTAAEISRYVSNPVEVAAVPEKEELVRQVIEWFV
jgi:uroporphyrinogen-III synthase